MKLLKRITLGAIILFLLAVIAAIALPYFFKDKIISYAVDRANEELTAEIGYSDVELSLIRSFPRVSLGLQDFSLVSKDKTTRFDTISRIDQFFFSLNISDLWKDPDNIKVKGFEITNGILNLHIDEEGNANYLIYEDSSEDPTRSEEESSSKLKNIALDNYALNNLNIQYIDESQNLELQIANLHHRGSGQFDAVNFEFQTETKWDDLKLRYDGITYVNQLSGKSELKLLADTKNQRYELLDNFIKLNELNLESNGVITLQEYPNLDLTFSTSQTKFRQVLSLIPAIYQREFEDLETRGEFTLNGQVKGQIGPGDRIPSFDIQSDIINGYFKYADLPEAVSDVNAHLEVQQKGQLLDQTKVNITDLELSLAGDKSAGELFMHHLFTNPQVRGKLKGRFNPDKISQMIYLEDIQLGGEQFNYDLSFAGDQNSILNEDYGNIEFSGEASIVNSHIELAPYPRVLINSLQSTLSPEQIQVKQLEIQAGKSDFKGDLFVQQPLAYFDNSTKPLLSGAISSKQLIVDEWLPEDTEEPSNNTSNKQESAAPSDAYSMVPVDLELDYNAGLIEVMDYKLTEVQSRTSFSNDQLNIKKANGKYDGTAFSMVGKLDQIVNYSLFDGILMGSIQGDLGTIDLTPFIASDESNSDEAVSSSSEEQEYDLSLPERIHLSINLDADKMILADNTLRNATLTAELTDRKFIISEARGKTFGGYLGLRGIFETPEGQKPKMDFHYDMKNIVYKEIFNALPSFQKLAPLAEFIEGKFNLDLEFSGLVNNDLGIDMNSIQADGFLNTINATIESFPALKSLSNKFDLGGLEDGYRLANTKNWLQIRDGKVTIREFVRELGGLDYRIQGSHSIDQSMDYQVRTSIPKDRLKGTGLAKGMDLLADQAGRLGLNLNQAEYIDVQFKLLGDFSDPKLDFKVLGVSSGDGNSTNLKDQAKEQIEDKLEKEKQEALDRLEEEKRKKEEELRKKMEEEKMRLKEEKAKREEELRKKLEEEKRKKEEELRKKAEEEKDKLKKKLKDLNPFGGGG